MIFNVSNFWSSVNNLKLIDLSVAHYMALSTPGGEGVIVKSRREKKFCLLDLMLYVPVNSYDHVGTSPPILWDFYPTLR